MIFFLGNKAGTPYNIKDEIKTTESSEKFPFMHQIIRKHHSNRKKRL